MTIFSRGFRNYHAFLTAVKEGRKYGKIVYWKFDTDKNSYKDVTYIHNFHVCEIVSKNGIRRLSCDVMEVR